MRKLNSRTLVVDASVALASGISNHPISKGCRDVLESILTICHHIAIDDTLQFEYFENPSLKGKNTSRFFRTWLISMHSRKKVIRIQGRTGDKFAGKLGSLNIHASEKQILIEDSHLIELALQHDSIVVSCDEEAHIAFKEVAKDLQEIQKIMWINPVEPDYSEWLNNGCKPFQGYEIGE